MKKRILAGLLAAFVLTICFPTTVVKANELEDEAEARKELPVQSNNIDGWPQGPIIGAEAAILIDADSGAVLYAKNIHEHLFPASVTKIMTTQLAIEKVPLDDMVTFSHEAVFGIPRNSSNIAIDVGEKLTVDQCLQAILIASANEVSAALAEHVAGSSEGFVEMMNERAEELGCKDTHFVTPNGLHDDNHYTSAYDLALIAIPFFKNELLCKYASTSKLHLAPTENQPDDIVAWSKNDLYENRKYAYEGLVGSKTGFTDNARQTLVSCAQKDGMRLICVILKEESPNQFTDTVDLFNYGFSNFAKIPIAENEKRYNIEDDSFFYSNTDVFGSSNSMIYLNSDDSIVLPKSAAFSDAEAQISYEDPMPGTVATITYTYHGNFVGKAGVNLTGDRAAYEFTGEMNTIGDEEEEETDEENIIFLNVKKILLIVSISAAVIIIVIISLSIIRAYHFGNSGRGRLRRRRRRKRHGGRNSHVHF